MKNIFIVIINYKRDEDTISCLNSLMDIDREGFLLNVVVVDNYPPKRTDIEEKSYAKLNLKIILNSVNSGFSGGMNTGIKYAIREGADYILVHNNDTFVKGNFLKVLFDFMEKNEDAGIVSPKIYFAKGYEFHKDKYKNEELGKVIWYGGGIMDWGNVIGKHRGVDEVDNGQFNGVKETDFATGCSMLVSRKVFEEVGLFNENYFLYYEDNDLSYRAKKAGYKVYFVPQSIVWHKNAGSTGGSGSRLQDYFITRNRLYFGMRHAGIRSKIALLKECFKLILKGREGQKRGAIDFLINKMGKGSLDL